MSEKLLRINLGAGDWKREGWLSLDGDPGKCCDVTHDLRRMPYPFADASAGFFFSSHVLEHMTYVEAESCLRECWRILAPRGAIRVAVPDTEAALRAYVQGDRAWFDAAQGETGFNIWKRTLLETLGEFVLYPDVRQEFGHHSAFDFETLKAFLEVAGFACVEQSAFRQSRFPEFVAAQLDNRPAVTLFMEAERP